MKAFPQKYPQDPLRACFELNPIESGMDLRDYFAAEALNGTISAIAMQFTVVPDYLRIAEECYRFADAMMEARK